MKKRVLGLLFAVLAFTLALPARAQTTIGNGQTIGALWGSQGSARYYRIYVPSGQARLVFQTWGGSGDADLYVRLGALPTTGTSTARSLGTSNSETITINNPAAGNWYIMVRGFRAYSGAYLRATYSSSTIATLSNGRTVGTLWGSTGSARYYRFYVPSGRSRVVFQTWGGSGDADLYVRYHYGLPSTSVSTARNTAIGNNATITVYNPRAGYWYILVRGHRAYSGAYLRATYYGTSAPATPTGLTATQTWTQQVRLTWNAASRASYYEVWRRTTTSSTATRIATTTARAYSDTRAVAGTTYYYWVRARNSTGASGFSARATGRRVSSIATLISGRTYGTLWGALGSARYYRVYVPSGQSRLVVQTWGGSGDADLYVRYGALPSTAAYNGRSISSSNTDTVTINNPGAGYWYILVRGARAYSGAYIRATYSGSTYTLSSGRTIGTLWGSTGSARYYRIYVPSGRSRLVVQTWGGSGDADLYVRYNATPTTTAYTRRSTSSTNTDTVTIYSPSAGYWYIMVRGYRAYSGLYLRPTIVN